MPLEWVVPLASLLITGILSLATAPSASADYKACMEFCMAEHDNFAHCHDTCKDMPTTADTEPASRSAFKFTPPPADICSRHGFAEGGGNCARLKEEFHEKQLFRSGDCSVEGAQGAALDSFVVEHYVDLEAWMVDPAEDDQGAWEVYIGLEGRNCEGVVRVSDDCQIRDASGAPVTNAASRERAIRCKPD